MRKKIPRRTICALACLVPIIFLAGCRQQGLEEKILWWYDLTAPAFGSAAAADLDGDGKLELAFGTYFNDGNIYALNSEDGSLMWKFGSGGCANAAPAIADADSDGQLEVIIPCSSCGTLYCLDGKTGTVKWAQAIGIYNAIDSAPAVADLDQDQRPEIVLGTLSGFVYCFQGESGSIAWSRQLEGNAAIHSEPAVLDLNGDGRLEILVAQAGGNFRIYALTNSGAVLWFCNLAQKEIFHGASFADINEDGKPEIIIGSFDGLIYALHGADGSLDWKYQTANHVVAPTAIADLDGDGHMEIVYVSANLVGALNWQGLPLWSYEAAGEVLRGPAIANMDGDDHPDLIFASATGHVYVLSGAGGHALWEINLAEHMQQEFPIDQAPLVADFNGDGKLEIFIVGGYGIADPATGNYGRAYLLQPRLGQGPGWTMFRHDLRHSGCFNNAP
jgi:outer membrane protein assembly factor BamB